MSRTGDIQGERLNAILCSDSCEDPMDAIKAPLKELFQVIEDCLDSCRVFESMALRCE